MTDPAPPVTDESHPEAWTPPELTSREEARRWAWALILEEINQVGAEYAAFDFREMQYANGKPKSAKDLTLAQAHCVMRAEATQNVVFMDKSCRSKGPKWYYTLYPVQSRTAALKMIIQAGVAEAAKKMKKETDTERLARIKRELAELGFKAVPV